METSIIVAQSIELAGLAANVAASKHVFSDYQSRAALNTLRAHYSDLATFSLYLGAAGVSAPTADDLQNYPDSWRGMTHGLIRGFVVWTMGEGLAVSTVNRKLHTVRLYAGLAAQAGVIGGDTLALIKAVKGYAPKEYKRVDEKRSDQGQATRQGFKKAHSTTLEAGQVKALKAQPNTPQGRRDAVLMCLLLDHGLRVGELAGLTVTDVNLQTGELRFYRPKVNKTQTHKLTADARRALRSYFTAGDVPALGLLLRGSNKGGNLAGPGMTERSITRRVAQLGERAEIDGLSAHDLRHAWATRAIRKGTDPFALQQAGGWTSMATVRKYVDESVIANEGVSL